MKKTVRTVILLLIVVLASTGLSACAKDQEKITSLLAEFEYSCNTLDVESILDCIHPSMADKMKLAAGVIGKLTGKDTSEVLENISTWLIGDSALDGNDFFSSIKIEVEDIKIDGEEAIASTLVAYKINGAPFNRRAEFKCTYHMEKWYISKFSFAK